MTIALARHRSAAWQLCLAAAPVAVLLYYGLLQLGSEWAAAAVVVYGSANGLLGLCSLVAARRHPALRPMLYLLAAGGLSSVVGDLIFYTLALRDGEPPFPSVADLFYLALFPFVAGAFLVVIRRRTPGWDAASVIDAAIVTVSAGYLTYEFVIAPTTRVTTGDLASMVAVAYPVGDLMLITVGARLMLGAGPRTLPLKLIGVYLGALLYADSTYSVQTLAGSYRTGNYLDAIWMVGCFLFAAAVLHPDLPKMAERSPTATPDATPARLLLLAGAAVMAPGSMIVQYLRGDAPHVVVGATACIVLILLVLGRMAGLVGAQRHTAITDELTGLRSRRFFVQALRSETTRRGRLSLLLLDVDHFKSVNDTFGHDGGDRVLTEVARRLADSVRGDDLVARYGGEEFAVLLPRADEARAAEIAERIRERMARDLMPVGDGRTHRVTVSIGAATMPTTAPDEATLIRRADEALYAAKHAGRNRVVTAQPATEILNNEPVAVD
ncbi:GGDEF domain-containing protein [Actinoplanes sp. LDG1-06]|uniref:GGDEF domain-containing protein n=1 Tax=Paractinoplanes ovalisporus TaxID=2810368 RepID=A0ABS2AL43_9ACTN|nr:GGDEF domain-containing protein [Actinoplanes ovalisporus]MBM2620577.1 GGDEF domain-containing protein [Actinoplanes ovalisporus]